MVDIKRHNCHQILVPAETCRLEFVGAHPKGKIRVRNIGMTARGETVLVWVDERENIVSIELMGGPEKPCHEPRTCPKCAAVMPFHATWCPGCKAVFRWSSDDGDWVVTPRRSRKR